MAIKKYKPVPVKAAMDLAKDYDKSVCIIITFDPAYGLLHTTTWGESQNDKLWAAEGGDMAAKILGADFSRKKTYEDFRKKQKLSNSGELK